MDNTLKRRRDELSDDDDDDAEQTGPKWDDPHVLDEMGVSRLASDTNSDEGDSTEILDSDDGINENKRPAKKRKTGQMPRERKPLREQPSSNIIESKSSRLEDCKLEKLKPAQCVIKNSQVTYGANEEKDVRTKRKCTESICSEKDNDDFKLSRLSLRKQDEPMGINYMDKLPIEVVLEILLKLDRRSLVQCCYVSRRLNMITRDESLWCRVDLSGRHVPRGGLPCMLARGPRIVRMASACIPDLQFSKQLPIYCQLPRNFACKIEYLDLSMATISTECLSKLLGYCDRLIKLSLEHCTVNDTVMAAIARNTGLQVANLTMCAGITSRGLRKMLEDCQSLQSLNLGWTNLSACSIEKLAELLPRTMERLTITGCRHNLKDNHVLEIVKRCDNLLELDISDCIDLTEATVDHIVNYGWSLEYLGLSRCYSIPLESLRNLQKLDSLVFLDMFGLCQESQLQQFRTYFESKIRLNQFMFSSVARPTVGIRRTSIWGLRIRD